ncbi:hypothetical protein ACET3Z_017074 [Daucus carota]
MNINRKTGEHLIYAVKMKRCRREEKDEKKRSPKSIKQCSTESTSPLSWSDLDPNMVGEIKKKLYNWADYIRFSSVCKSWQAAEHETRAADVLPWLMVVDRPDISKINCYLFEPSAPHLRPVVSHTIKLDQFFDISSLDIRFSIIYVDGCLLMSMFNTQATCSSFVCLSLPSKKVCAIPRLHHPQVYRASGCEMFRGVSTSPSCADCVFLALHITDDYKRSVSIFRHGDTDWTTTEFVGGWFGVPCAEDVVFINGVFYFLLWGGRLGSYDTATGELECHHLECEIELRSHKFFGLDGELMVKFWDINTRTTCIRRFDWSHHVWAPLQNLGNQSLFLSRRSVYADKLNYYGVSANKIYVRQGRGCGVYSLENGQLLYCSSSGLRNWDGLDYNMDYSVWVEPFDLLPK